MKLKLLAPHVIQDIVRPRGFVLDPPPPGYRASPLMEGLDEEGIAAVERIKLEVFGRYSWPYGMYPPTGPPLDDPPIPRPLDDNQPVTHYTGVPYWSLGEPGTIPGVVVGSPFILDTSVLGGADVLV